MDAAPDGRLRVRAVGDLSQRRRAARHRDGFLAGVADAVEAAGGIVEDPRLTVVYHTRRRRQDRT